VTSRADDHRGLWRRPPSRQGAWRCELRRTFRNARLFIFSLGFPLVLYFLIAGPKRNEHNLGDSGISAPLYFMMSLAAFGTMTAVIASAARIAAERSWAGIGNYG
jgi:ABC-2 type transport system permease protein